jgi:hypothetical protein
MASEAELWKLVAAGQQAVLATLKRDALPYLSNVTTSFPDAGRRTGPTPDRQKVPNLARDPRAVVHGHGDDFLPVVVAEGRTTLSPVVAEPAAASPELLAVHAAFDGHLDPDVVFAEMIVSRRVVVRPDLRHVYGIIASGGRRPVAS